MKGILTSLRLIRIFFRLSILNEAAYRANFVMQLLQSVISLVTSLILLQTIFSYTHALNGWTPPTLLTLIGIYFFMGGAINVVLLPSMSHFIKDVQQGTLDYMLLQPEDGQVLASTQQVEVWRLIDVIMGIVVIIFSVLWGRLQIDLGEMLNFVVTLLAGGTIIYSFLLLLSVLSIWYVKIDNILLVFQSMYEAGRWPTTIYPGWLRIILTLVVPIAFAITIPAQALVYHLTWYTLLGTIFLAIALLVGTRLFWKLGIRYYSGASS